MPAGWVVVGPMKRDQRGVYQQAEKLEAESETKRSGISTRMKTNRDDVSSEPNLLNHLAKEA